LAGQDHLGFAVGQVLHDGRAFGEDGAVVELQGGHIALGVDGAEVAPIAGLLGLEIDLDHVMRQAEFVQDDVG
jgi:hypothetical protein